MNKQGAPAESPTSQSLARILPTIVAAYLASLAVIAYPLGLYTLWTQMWREYTHDSFMALYAASLIPASAAAGRGALSVLDLLLYTGFAAGLISQVFIAPYALVPLRDDLTDDPVRTYKLFLEEGFFSFFRRISRRDKSILILMGVTFLGQAAILPLLVEIVTLDSLSDLPFYVCYLVFVIGGGIWGGLILSKNIVRSFVAIYTGALLAAMALIPLQQTSLPVAEFSDGAVREATLISHAAGYWYVIQEGERSVTAIPNDEVGTVKISERSR